MAKCPECNSRLTIISTAELWERIFCDVCGTQLEVVNLVPLELEPVYNLAGEDDDVLDELEDDDEDMDWEDDEEGDEGGEEW